jgi:hypothetical protein
MYHEIHSSGVAAHAQAAAIGELLAKYHVFRCERDLPQALELLPLLDTDDGPFLMRLVPEASGDLRYTFYGSAIAAAAGFDMTGKTIADFSSPVAKFFRHVYERSSRERRPLFTIHRATHAAAIHTWERLVLPVREEDGRIGFFTYNRPRVFQADLLRTVLDMLPDAIIAVHAQRNEAGQITGATLASANKQARELFQIDDRADVEAVTLRDCAEHFGGLPLLKSCIRAIDKRESSSTLAEAGEGATAFVVDIAPMLDGAVIRICDIRRAMQPNPQSDWTARGRISSAVA